MNMVSSGRPALNDGWDGDGDGLMAGNGEVRDLNES